MNRFRTCAWLAITLCCLSGCGKPLQKAVAIQCPPPPPIPEPLNQRANGSMQEQLRLLYQSLLPPALLRGTTSEHESTP